MGGSSRSFWFPRPTAKAGGTGEGRGEGRSGGDIFLFKEVRVDVIAMLFGCLGRKRRTSSIGFHVVVIIRPVRIARTSYKALNCHDVQDHWHRALNI